MMLIARFLTASVLILIPLLFHSLPRDFFLAGTEQGLYRVEPDGRLTKIWNGGEVKKIVTVSGGIFLLTSEGVFWTHDLKQFSLRSEGLARKVVKLYRDGKKSFIRPFQDLKDLKADPSNPSNLVTCTKDGVFVSRNSGLSWRFLPNPTIASGIKSVAIYSDPETHVLMGHPFLGIFRKNLTRNGGWTGLNTGLKKLSVSLEEISDILAVRDGGRVELFAANNFSPALYRLDRSAGSWKTVYSDANAFDLVESLFADGTDILSVGTNGVRVTRAYQTDNARHTGAVTKPVPHLDNILRRLPDGERVLCVAQVTDSRTDFSLSELWMNQEAVHRPTTRAAANRKGLYAMAGFFRNRQNRNSLTGLMKAAGLDMLVIDMKDDWGKLRFVPQSPLLKQMGETGNPIDLDEFTADMKSRGVYLVARLVLFQDRIIYRYDNGRYAVKSRSTGKPWQGRKRQKDGKVKLIGEYWVDPYSETVWEYNVEIARELIRRGFDEIQFDYVRFTTDGDNLDDTFYSHREEGMDRESAILSFLKYARENIPAPVSIDIYGANGWWRTGARTGQDVEMFRHYVDAICPMYYPSHFDRNFMLFEPFEKRTWRIYYYGSLRCWYFGRKTPVIRPYIQAFKMNYLKYDRDYYGPEYVANQVRGVEESIDMGYTFWNMGVKYQILSNVFRIGR